MIVLIVTGVYNFFFDEVFHFIISVSRILIDIPIFSFYMCVNNRSAVTVIYRSPHVMY